MSRQLTLLLLLLLLLLQTAASCACRQLGIVFGVLMQLSVLLPTLRHFRFINILGLVGTTYTAW
jgi:hypothetical protein